jgi:hypothetical protein
VALVLRPGDRERQEERAEEGEEPEQREREEEREDLAWAHGFTTGV